MKKALLTFAVVGTIFFSACEKDEFVEPINETSVKTDKGLACHRCGQRATAHPETAALVTYDAPPATTANAYTHSTKKVIPIF